ncbi:BAH_G0031240.mRNA.1.CDS.1 [Saccharomyces cerevisiae]|nr:SX2_G0003270.mRNA.1.CDS.1 [Saccharomyces cerevisiae]CAI4555879.1 BAH_G0031240.mRNA.1.CDS.1 [Saccharomyces cerevisiae]CAI4556935.1 BAG_1a_G0031320.mRNA.1.CDS.1 [Saccharomyces cerevisiae]CAI7174551.1 BAG_1a_G0031320.mRNA.1.CDS.1 [Saccharomyces cerevisiae]CAI7175730.1 BAH_G0031240.mRNA.1.CDS.1 [Saccharomyces cerevisiae]
MLLGLSVTPEGDLPLVAKISFINTHSEVFTIYTTRGLENNEVKSTYKLFPWSVAKLSFGIPAECFSIP